MDSEGSLGTPEDDGDIELVPKIQQLFDGGIDNLSLVKEVTRQSGYTSHHQETHIVEAKFSTLFHPNKYLTRKGLQRDSAFLETLNSTDGRIGYANEADIQAYVEMYITDILKALGWWLKNVKLVRQQALAGDTEPDLWVVKLVTGKPFCIIEVKVPGTNKLKSPKACGQLFDYMVQLRVSYGQCEIFGIITTLEEWRLCWFSDTQEAASAVELLPNSSLPNDLAIKFPIGEQLLQERMFHASEIFTIRNAALPKVLVSALVKSKNASHRVLPLLSSKRVYHTVTAHSYLWEKWTHDGSAELNFHLPAKSTTSFKILRHFHPGADGKVVLAISSSAKLCVIKFHFKDKDRLREEMLWRELYGVNVWTMRREHYQHGLILPFVFHCVTRPNTTTNTTTVEFSFDIASWSKEPHATVEPTNIFQEWLVKFTECYDRNHWTPLTAAKRAIEEIAKRGFTHRDIEWRHVGLMPIVHEDKSVDLKPVLIDLVDVVEAEQAAALKEMEDRLCEICKEHGIDFVGNAMDNAGAEAPHAKTRKISAGRTKKKRRPELNASGHTEESGPPTRKSKRVKRISL